MDHEPKKRRTSRGTCLLCQNEFGKAAMTRHLEKCLEAHPTPPPSGKKEVQEARLVHLRVEGAYGPEYWLNLEARADATFRDLDRFLRNLWLECCGHMSAFTLGNSSRRQSMSVPLGRALAPGLTFRHEYDFGSTTELKLKALSERRGIQDASVRLLARNVPPDIMCDRCGQPAAQICTLCLNEDNGMLCEGCAAKHGCDECYLLPLVNSPRTGVCGYEG